MQSSLCKMYDSMERPFVQAPLDGAAGMWYSIARKKRKEWKDASFFLLNERNRAAAFTAALRPPAGNDPSRPPFVA